MRKVFFVDHLIFLIIYCHPYLHFSSSFCIQKKLILLFQVCKKEIICYLLIVSIKKHLISLPIIGCTMFTDDDDDEDDDKGNLFQIIISKVYQ